MKANVIWAHRSCPVFHRQSHSWEASPRTSYSFRVIFLSFDQNFPIDMKKLLFVLSSRNSVGRFLLKIHC